MLKYVVAFGMLGAVSASARAQVQVSTTLETYFMTRDDVRGAGHRLSWGETSVRFNPNVAGKLSFTERPDMRMLDEAYVSAESGLSMLRVGRFRTAFGFSDWSDLFYNGFNHSPLVRVNGLVDGLRLNRDDTGLETTVAKGRWQAQIGLIDTRSSLFQVGPKEIRHGSLRLQTDVGGVLIAVDALKDLNEVRDVYGVDFRWGIPHWVIRAEAMKGVGDRTSWGYYLDAAYRPNGMPRTQIVARTERLSHETRGDLSLHTVGVRQVVWPELTVNVNYGWAERSNDTFAPSSVLTGFSVQTMFQVRF